MNKELLKKRRKKAGFTKAELAKQMKMPLKKLNRKLEGEEMFDISEILNLCGILHIEDNQEKIQIFLDDVSQKRDDAEVES